MKIKSNPVRTLLAVYDLAKGDLRAEISFENITSRTGMDVNAARRAVRHLLNRRCIDNTSRASVVRLSIIGKAYIEKHRR
jgi:hypothetical protein